MALRRWTAERHDQPGRGGKTDVARKNTPCAVCKDDDPRTRERKGERIFSLGIVLLRAHSKNSIKIMETWWHFGVCLWCAQYYLQILQNSTIYYLYIYNGVCILSSSWCFFFFHVIAARGTQSHTAAALNFRSVPGHG